MKRKLTDREISLVARMLRIGMVPETIARVVKADATTITSLMDSNGDCKNAVQTRAGESVVAKIIQTQPACEGEAGSLISTALHAVMDEANHAATVHFSNITELRRFIATRYGISETQMDDESRIKRHVRAREAAVCAARLLWPHLSLLQIGRHFANRPHTTIHHILKKHKLPTAAVATGIKHAA